MAEGQLRKVIELVPFQVVSGRVVGAYDDNGPNSGLAAVSKHLADRIQIQLPAVFVGNPVRNPTY